MTKTFLVAAPETGTQQVIATDEASALSIARQYLGTYAWQVVGTVAPVATTTPTYHPELIGQRDPLDTEE